MKKGFRRAGVMCLLLGFAVVILAGCGSSSERSSAENEEQPERVQAMDSLWQDWADRVGVFPKS